MTQQFESMTQMIVKHDDKVRKAIDDFTLGSPNDTTRLYNFYQYLVNCQLVVRRLD